MRSISVTALVLVACTGGRNVDVAPPDRVSYDTAFAVVTDLDGNPARVVESFAIVEGKVMADGPRYYSLDLDTEQLRVVGLSHDRLVADLPGFVAARAEDISLAVATPSPTPVLVGDTVEMAPPPYAEVWLLSDEDPARFVSAPDADVLRAGLTLTVPNDREYCRRDEALTPFASAVELLPSDISGAFVQQLMRLSDDRVLALTKAGVFLLDRTNRPDEPTLAVRLWENETIFPRAKRMAVRRAGDRLTILIAGDVKLCPTEDCDEGRTWRVEIDGTSLVSLETSTTAPDIDLGGIVLDDDRSVVVGDTGTLWIGDDEGRGLSPGSPIDDEVVDLDRIVLTNDTSAPHFVGGSNGLYLGNAFLGTWTKAAISTPDGSRARFAALAVGREHWAVTQTSGFVFRAAPGANFTMFPLPPPPSMAACALSDSSRAIEVAGLAVDNDKAVFVAACTALLRLDADGCTTSIPIADRTIASVPDMLTAVEISDRWITAGGAGGAIYELRR